MTHTYQNFDLLITHTASGYNARVIAAPAGQANVDFVLPFSPDELRGFYWLSGRILRHLRAQAEATVPPLVPKTFGSRLYEAVFAGGVGSVFLRSLDAAGRDGAGLRIRLRLDAVPELADLPWEYLYATGLERHPALSQATPLVRYLELPQPEQILTIRPPLRVLGIVASPSDVRALDVEQEWRQLHDALADLQSRQLLILERLEKATLPALQARLRGEAVHILHFIGHGDFDAERNEGGLLFEDEQGGSHLVRAERLATLLHDHPALRLAFLNACQGAQGGRSDPFAGVAQKLVQQEVPSVLAMQFPVSDKAAIGLAYAFYKALAEAYPVDAALAEARKAIYAAGDDREWGTPVLFSRSPDNRLLELPQGDARPVIERQDWEPETVLIPGGAFIMGSEPGAGVPANETPAHTVTLPDYRMGKYPITNRQYAAFIKQTRYEPPNRKLWFNREPMEHLDHPVTDVNWHDAVAYCAWLSERTGRRYQLPSEAEWEKAARGPDGRRYPWGDTWRAGCCNVGSNATTPVAALPAGASSYGCHDLLGNVQEWTRTLWGNRPQPPDFSYPYDLDDGREVTDAADLPAQARLVQRGGSFKSATDELRCTLRGQSDPASKIPWRGFRVVMAIT